jgi:hypothetical protein
MDERYPHDDLEPGEPDYSPPVRRRPRPRRQRGSTAVMTVRLTALSVVAAAVIGGGLAVQMAAGSDPALGPKQAKVVKTSASSNSSSANTATPSEVTPTEVTPTAVAPTQSAPAPVTSSTS